MTKAKFIVIEGGDGAGKETQTKLLAEKAKRESFRVATTTFPDYEIPTGIEVKRYLDGEYGSLNEIDPRFISTLYMFNRRDKQQWIERTLAKTDLLISDRYASANMGYLGAKFNGDERDIMIGWSKEFEHGNPLNHIHPDKIIYLDLPPNFSQDAMKTKHKDIHEKDKPYQKRVRETFLHIAKKEDNWSVVDCLNGNGKRKTRDEVRDELWDIISPTLTKNRPQIYFSAPISAEKGSIEERKEGKNLIKRIGDVLNQHGDILSAHVTADNPREEQIKLIGQYGNVYLSDMSLLERANLLVAEVSTPSNGIGREIERATALGIPVHVFFKDELKSHEVSRMITDDHRINAAYYNKDDLERVIGTNISVAIQRLKWSEWQSI
jgi:dTMP kinase